MLKYIFGFLFIAVTWALVLWLELPVWIAMATTAVILAILLTVFVYGIYKAKKSAKEIEKALTAQGEAHAASVRPDLKANVDAMQGEFLKAVGALKSSKLARRPSEALYALPWYMIIGPPGVGKSTALRNSGLRFPYLSSRGAGSVQGVGGTRNCEWWMTNEAVILDTAGRYTTEDNDREEWFAFLDLLKKHRARRPVNGILVAVSVADIAMTHPDHVSQQAKDIRARVDEVMGRLSMVVPVYILFTKCDLLPGFVETFADLSPNDRKQIWGFTFPLNKKGRPDPGRAFAEHFEELSTILEKRSLRRMSDERALEGRDKIHEFPQYFGPLRDTLARFVGELMAENIYAESPIMRGCYFTSGTQEGRPIDRIMNSMAEAFGIQPKLSVTAPATEAKSYFLGDLFYKVIFPDRFVAARSAKKQKRQRLIGHAIGGVLLMLAAGIAFFPLRAFQENREILAESELAVQRVAEHMAEETVDPILLNRIEPLGQLERSVDGLNADPPWSKRWGMYQGYVIYPRVRDLYSATVRKELLLPIVEKDIDEMRRFANRYAAGDSQATEEEHRKFKDKLRMYLLLTDSKEPNEPGPGDEGQIEWLPGMIAEEWAVPLKMAGDPAAHSSMEAVAAVYVGILTAQPELSFEREKKLVARVRRVLNRTDRTSQILEELLKEVDAPDLRLRDMTSSTVIRNDNRKIRGAFTRSGWEDHIRDRLSQPLDDLMGQEWVLGRSGDEASELAAEELLSLRSQYFKKYIEEWKEFVGGIYVAGPQTYVEALTMMQDLTRGANPPFTSLFTQIAYNTHLEELVPEGEEEGGDNGEAAAEAGNVVGRELSRTRLGSNRLVRLGRRSGRVLTKLAKNRNKEAGQGAKLFTTSDDVGIAFGGLSRFGARKPPPEVKEGAPPPPPETVPLDAYQEQLAYIRDALQAQIDDPTDKKKLTNRVKTARNAVKGLIAAGDAGTWRPRLETLLWPPIEGTWGLVGVDVVGAIGKDWCNNAVAAFERSLAGRYPFNQRGRDVPLADYAAFFAPDKGQLWTYYKAALEAYVPRQGNTYGLAERGEASKVQYKNQLVDFLNAAHDMSTVMFPVGTEEAIVEFDVMITGAQGISETIFTVDGVSIAYRNGPTSWQRITWPGSGSQKGARIFARGFGLEGNIQKEGEWGLFRLLEAGTATGSAKGDVFSVKFDMTDQGAGVVGIKIKPVRPETPFWGFPGRGTKFMGVFRDKHLRIPQSIVVGSSACNAPK